VTVQPLFVEAFREYGMPEGFKLGEFDERTGRVKGVKRLGSPLLNPKIS